MASESVSSPRVGLFIPCYIVQLYPEVGLATVRLLERFGVTIDFPEAQTCCGQPMANTGCTEAARPLAERFLYVVLDASRRSHPSPRRAPARDAHCSDTGR